MSELIEAVKAWPVIVQGALGSALFWLVLVIGTRARSFLLSKHSHYSKEARLSWLVNQQTRLEAITARSLEHQTHRLLFLFYRASRPLLKALMWLVYGLVMDSVFSPAGVVGYIVCLSFLFKAYEVLGPIDTNIDHNAKLKEINEEIRRLNEA